MTNYEILPGLPPYGDPARNFELRPGKEGFVVRFTKADGNRWIGNFATGFGNGTNTIVELQEKTALLILATGAAYIVQIEAETAQVVAGYFFEVYRDDKHEAIVLNNQGISFTAIGQDGLVKWESDRISWDGFRNVFINGDLLVGEAYAPWDPPHDWKSFSIDLMTGLHAGGNYE